LNKRRRSPIRPPSKPVSQVVARLTRPESPAADTPADMSDAMHAEVDTPSPARHGAQPEESVRLHKALADAGIGSRRDMETWIAEGRVTVNGATAQVGDRVTSSDVIKVSGHRVYLRAPDSKRVRVLLYHKQEGEIVSRDDPKGRVSVFDQLPKIRGAKWVSVGRLDYNTEGLLIFTSSGELANRLMHPKFEVEREYAVRVLGELTPEMQKQLVQGVELDDGEAKLESLMESGGEGVNRWWRVVIMEGRYREVRRLFDAVGIKVSRLIRTRYGPVVLPPQLKRGQKYELDEENVSKLLTWAGLDAPKSKPRTQNSGAVKHTKARSAPASRTRHKF
jgi:23S rRNA pseudouridine2605 synthase